MKIEDILNSSSEISVIISELKQKTFSPRPWSDLVKEYDTKYHPVNSSSSYRDKVTKGGIEEVTRVSLAWQKLAVKRMTELIFATPPKRIYNTHNNEQEQKVADIIEDILKRNRYDSLNLKRGVNLFASCESATIWYGQVTPSTYANEKTDIKLRCATFSPMDNAEIYPFFDEYNDLIALSISYKRIVNENEVLYFDTYTQNLHIRWKEDLGGWTEELREAIEIGKINGVYIVRKEPIWENESKNVYEAEWTLSRNGNYIRKNAKPIFAVFSDSQKIRYGSSEGEKEQTSRDILQFGANDKAQYLSWTQAIESIKFHIDELKKNFFMALQLPDMSMENMKATPMSGEARKMMFIDAILKVKDEQGIWLEMFDREINVIKAFVKRMYPRLAHAVDSLGVEIEITPFTINDESELVDNLTKATGGKAIMSQRTAIANLGWVDNVEDELTAIQEEGLQDTATFMNEITQL